MMVLLSTSTRSHFKSNAIVCSVCLSVSLSFCPYFFSFSSLFVVHRRINTVKSTNKIIELLGSSFRQFYENSKVELKTLCHSFSRCILELSHFKQNLSKRYTFKGLFELGLDLIRKQRLHGVQS